MPTYDTLLIGSGYAAIGYAIARGNCLIVEEEQCCDTHFYLPLRGFRYHDYRPVTEQGRRLHAVFTSLSLFRDGTQNTNGFECALSRYLIEGESPELLLKCRAVSRVAEGDGYRVTLSTNEGLLHRTARRVIDTRNPLKEASFTVLYVSREPKTDAEALTAAFPGSTVEGAFYEGRYALHIPTLGRDENEIKAVVHRVFSSLPLAARILYMAPVFAREGGAPLCDDRYQNPIEAFEAGYLLGKEDRS